MIFYNAFIYFSTKKWSLSFYVLLYVLSYGCASSLIPAGCSSQRFLSQFPTKKATMAFTALIGFTDFSLFLYILKNRRRMPRTYKILLFYLFLLSALSLSFYTLITNLILSISRSMVSPSQ